VFKENGISKEVDGKTSNVVIMLEAESKINMNATCSAGTSSRSITTLKPLGLS
jgi:hypothetical protein